MVDIRGADGRDNRIMSNLPSKLVNLNLLSNMYILHMTSEGNNAYRFTQSR